MTEDGILVGYLGYAETAKYIEQGLAVWFDEESIVLNLETKREDEY